MKQTIGYSVLAGSLLCAMTWYFTAKAQVEQPSAESAIVSQSIPVLPSPIVQPTPISLTPETPKAQPSIKPVDLSTKLSSQSREVFQSVLQAAETQNLSGRSYSEIIQFVASQLIGSAYTENLLDQGTQETLFLSLRQFDCVLFVEAVLALSHNIALQDRSEQAFATHVQSQRYRGGVMNGYCSRLHYFSDWITDNQSRGAVTDLTLQLGGQSLNKPINFMSTHWKSYAQLVESQANYQCIQTVEARVSSLPTTYVPTAQIHTLYAQLQPGDIIAIATRVPGLDVTHTGLVYRDANGNAGLIHAAPNSGVKISRDLQTYVERVEDAIGIIITRPNDPRRNIVQP